MSGSLRRCTETAKKPTKKREPLWRVEDGFRYRLCANCKHKNPYALLYCRSCGKPVY